MADPFAKTRYRVAQHWRFLSDTPEVWDTLIVTAVEDHPTQGIVCAVGVAYDPPFQMSPSSSMGGGNYWFTQAALDASVTELVAEKGPFPRHLGAIGEFRRAPDSWGPNPHPFADVRTVGEVVREAHALLVQERDEAACRPPYTASQEESQGLWSLFAYDNADRFRELLGQHPSLANDPLLRDLSDDYCYTGDEYEECYPLMLAAELGSVEVAKVLLACGPDVRRWNNRGETALHFSGRASSGSDGIAQVARMLCDHGADPNALNRDGKPPLTCNYCRTEVAAVQVEFGAKLNMNHALRLGKLDWVRQQLRDNPRVVMESPYPDDVFDDVANGISWDPSLDDGPRDYGKFSGWYRRAELEKEVFESRRDILEGLVARGADPNGRSALSHAVQHFDTSLAEWLLERGADPNRYLKMETATYMPDIARTRRMVNLLKRYGAVENLHPHKPDKWEQQIQQLKDQFV